MSDMVTAVAKLEESHADHERRLTAVEAALSGIRNDIHAMQKSDIKREAIQKGMADSLSALVEAHRRNSKDMLWLKVLLAYVVFTEIDPATVMSFLSKLL